MQEADGETPTREKLIAGALRSVREKGYSNTSIRDVANASGVNLAMVSYYFGGKDALLAEVFDRCFGEWHGRVRDAVEAAGQDPSGLLAAVFRAVVDGFAEARDAVVSCVEALAPALRDERLRARLAEGYRQFRAEGAQESAQALRAAGHEPPERIEDVMSLLIAICDGLMLQWIADPAAVPDSTRTLTALKTLGLLALAND